MCCTRRQVNAVVSLTTSIARSPNICDNLAQRSSMPPHGVDGCEKVPLLCGRDSRRGPCLQALWTRSGARRFAVCAVRNSHAVGNGSRHHPTRSPQEANQRRHVACDDRLRARVSGLVLLVVQPSTVCACDAARGGRCSFLSDGTNATPATAVNSSRWRKRASMTLETRGVCRVIPLATSGEASVEANGS